MKKIVFMTGTRADFGKLKSLMKISQNSKEFEVHIFVTGMHMNKLYGNTYQEVYKSGFQNIFRFINHDSVENMDRTLSKTIDGFSHYVCQINPDLIVVHGDRVEAMAGAIVGSLNNILVAHIEGGELSGTVDELIRHAVSKMSHIHLVANKSAKDRLLQLGELPEAIHIIGSPDLDLMNSKTLPELIDAQKYYDVGFDSYAIAMFHPVTTEYKYTKQNAKLFVDALIDSGDNYIVVYPNNDLGSAEIIDEYKRLQGIDRIKIFPSIRFEYFLTFLKSSEYIVGNSSAGVREAPYYDIPTIDIGSRQSNRSKSQSIFPAKDDQHSILNAISEAKCFSKTDEASSDFGDGNSDKLFLEIIKKQEVWDTNQQKQFQDL